MVLKFAWKGASVAPRSTGNGFTKTTLECGLRHRRDVPPMLWFARSPEEAAVCGIRGIRVPLKTMNAPRDTIKDRLRDFTRRNYSGDFLFEPRLFVAAHWPITLTSTRFRRFPSNSP